MKRVLVSGYIGFDNFGDEAIFYALSNHLKKINYKVSVLCNNPEKVSTQYNVEAYYFKSLFNVIKAILKNDILISGGGSLLQNKTSSFSLFYYLFVIFIAKILFKKVIIFSQGFEKIEGRFQEFITEAILKTVDFVSVRDEKSLKLLSKYNIKADLTSDPVYSILSDIEINQNKQGVLVQLREFRGIDENFIENLSAAISQNNIKKISVFPFQDEYDLKISKIFIEKLKRYDISADLITNKGIIETINIINSHKFVISTRLHGAMISNALQTKTFAIIYDEKIKTLCEELDIENIDILNYSKEELKEKLKLFFNNKEIINKPYRKFDWKILDNYLKQE